MTVSSHSPAVPSAVSLSAELPEQGLAFVRALRDATGRGECPVWRGETAGAPPGFVERLHHLWPPASLDGPGAAEAWARHFEHGRLCYRRGPGFVVVHDARSASGAREVLLDGGEALRLFEYYESPRPLPQRSHPDHQAVGRLLADGLLLELGGLALALPYRLTRLALPMEVLGHG